VSDELWMASILPDPLVLHDGEKIEFCNQAFVSLVGDANFDKSAFSFTNWLRDTLRSDESFAQLLEAFEGKKSISLAVEAKARGVLRYWNIVSYLALDGIKRLTYFQDLSAAQAKKSYWDLHVRMSNATAVLEGEIDRRKQVEGELLSKSRELSLSNRELTEKMQELHKLQEQLLISSKMSALGEMAGGIAHEINTPLAIIKVLSGQLTEILVEEPLDKPMLTKIGTDIELTVGRIAKIINGLRSFSRDASSDPFMAESVRTIVSETLALCEERMKQHNIRLQADEVPSHLNIECRRVQISQVLLNLLNNSIDALGAIADKWIQISIQEDGDFIKISVVDSGHGIPSNIREKLFQPFFTTKEVGSGTGLGLSVSRGLIDAHNGMLSIDASSANTRFVIRVPKFQPIAK